MSYFTAQSGFWDTISSIGKTAGSTVINVYGEQKKIQGQNELLMAQQAGQGVAAPSMFPSWLLPVALVGVGAVVLMMVLKKPRQNPSKRQHRRRKRPGRRNEYFTINPRRRRRRKRRNPIVWGNLRMF